MGFQREVAQFEPADPPSIRLAANQPDCIKDD